MSIADLRPDTALELNRRRFLGHQQQTLDYCQTLWERLRSRRCGGKLPADHPGRPQAEEASIAEMKRYGDALCDLSANAWLPSVEMHDIGENTLLVDELRDRIQIDVTRIDGVTDEARLLTEDVEIETANVPFDLSLSCRVPISREDFEGVAECRLQSFDASRGTAVYSVAFCD